MSEPVDIHRLARDLNARVGDLVGALGLDGRREGNDYVAFNPTRTDRHLGSFRICIRGAKRGTWCDFADPDRARGDALELIAYVRFAGEKRPAITWALDWLGRGAVASARPPGAAGWPSSMVDDEAAGRAEAGQRARQARAIWLNARADIRGTPADLYLRGRGLDLTRLGRQPRALRYSDQVWCSARRGEFPAMLAAIIGPDGQQIAVHRTYLQRRADGTWTKAPVANPKRVLGAYRGAAIRLWRGATARSLSRAVAGEIVAIAEGIEDGVAAALATPELRVLAAVSVGNFRLMLPPAVAGVRLLAQNDKIGSPAWRALRAAAVFHVKQGRRVWICEVPGTVPDPDGGGDREVKDLADLAKMGLG